MDHKTDNLASVIVILPIFGAVFGLLWLTPPVLFNIGMAITAILALREYYLLFTGADFEFRLVGILSLIISSMYLLETILFPFNSISISISLALIVLFSAVVLEGKAPSREEFFALAAGLFGFAYIALPFSFLCMIRYMAQGRNLITTIILIVWARELGAGIGGMLFPRVKNPINIKLNPRKTYTGALLGLCLAILMALFSIDLLSLDFSIGQKIMWGSAIGVVCQFGDLSESYLKRLAGKRHSSSLLGSRGGVLDIVDAFIFSLSTAYFLLLIWGYQ